MTITLNVEVPLIKFLSLISIKTLTLYVPCFIAANVVAVRKGPTTLNGAFIERVSVKKYSPSNGDSVYEVTFYPLDCGCGFPKFKSVSGQVQYNDNVIGGSRGIYL